MPGWLGGGLFNVALARLGAVALALALGLVVWPMPDPAWADPSNSGSGQAANRLVGDGVWRGLAVGQGPASDVWAAPDPSQVTWSLKPANGDFGTGRANFSYLVEPGGVIQDAMVVTNQSAVLAIDLKVYAADAMNTLDGQIDLAPAGATAEDVGAWVSLSDPELVEGLIHLEPAQAVTVNFTISVPAEAAPGDHAGGLVTSLVRETTDATLGVDSRLALRAYVTVTGQLTPGLAVADLDLQTKAALNPFGWGQAVLSYTLVNTGNARLVPTEVVTVKGPFGLAARAESQTLEEVLPGGRVQREVVVDGVMQLFRASATVQVDALAVGLGAEGQPAAAGGQASGWLVPWVWLAVVVALLVGTVWAGRRHGLRGVPGLPGRVGSGQRFALAQSTPGAEAENQPVPAPGGTEADA